MSAYETTEAMDRHSHLRISRLRSIIREDGETDEVARELREEQTKKTVVLILLILFTGGIVGGAVYTYHYYVNL